ncbi:MAG: ABC transporter permease [Saprospiraceae bacterium]
MHKNDFKLAFRHLAKHKTHTLLNLAGLSIGLAVCLLLFLWVRDELAYDNFHTKADRIHRAFWKARFGDNEWAIPLCPVPLAPALEREFGEVEKATQIVTGGFTLKFDNEYVREQNVLWVDEDFFDIFSVEVIAGDPKAAIADPNGVILTESAARRYFGEQNVVGQTLSTNDGQNWLVGAVLSDFPQQSHLQFDFLRPIKTRSFLTGRKDHWGSATCYTYFLLKPGMDAGLVQQKLQAYVEKNVVDDDFRKGQNYTSFPFQALTDIHLYSNLEIEISPNGSMAYVWIFGITGCFILLLACINFINLATARAATRAREVGVRKVLGSQRSALVGQFFAEAFLHVLLAVGAALILANLALPAFNEFADKKLRFNFLESPFLTVLVASLVVVTTLLAGAFPALVISAFQPVKVLKGQATTVDGGRRDWLRRSLVVTQFSISTALLVGMLIVRGQLDFMQKTRLGFDKERVLVVSRANALGNNFDVFGQKLLVSSAVEKVTASSSLPGKDFDSTIFLPEQPSNYQETSLSYAWVDASFVGTLGLRLVAGRDFQPGSASDSAGCLINEAAAKRLGWTDPVGKELTMGGFQSGKVLGVMEDFHFQSLHHAVEPVVLKLSPWPLGTIAVRLGPGQVAEGVAAVQTAWRELAPTTPLEYTFLDDDFQKLYSAEARMSRVFELFAVLAVFIACLGLFGLASFMAIQRTKEIGIRKVLGASVSGITGLLARDFLKLVLVAILIASPIAYYFMDKWLADFAYRIDMEWWMFVVAGAGAVAVASLTVAFQSIRAALANPVESLRSE